MQMIAQPWQLAILAFIAGFLLARWIYRRRVATTPPPRIDISDADIDAELREGHRVAAIRLCRQKYGHDLKHAVHAIDALPARLGLDT